MGTYSGTQKVPELAKEAGRTKDRTHAGIRAEPKTRKQARSVQARIRSFRYGWGVERASVLAGAACTQLHRRIHDSDSPNPIGAANRGRV